ncbi:hypothetical protein N7454_008880 [Penicillium verhagenii]|nr:hypothetical protein N7454_008880 [Penicillium verhagenii]
MGTNPRTRNDYTVGWICALPKELVAAKAILDDTHPNLPKERNDDNAYTLGRVGSHNVVIACLPKGRIGNNNAATVATRMTSTFPSIRFGLLVGIGGGVPISVRLGDVVVSSPIDEFGGVVQWDFGKAQQERTFKRTGALNCPPAELLSALTNIESNHSLTKGSAKIPQYLKDVESKWPEIDRQFTRSDRLRDIRFRADCKHIDIVNTEENQERYEDQEGDDDDDTEDEEEEDSCIHCDQTKIISRKRRKMRVHYGLIASGNQVIKDALFRDEINKLLGGKILCFEMEAAGLMNDFPCLVIRGICDYADAHKNKKWQKYAATVAAAFVKELLEVVQTKDVEQMPTITSLHEKIDTLGAEISEINAGRKKSEDAKILEWLTDVDHTAQHGDIHCRVQMGTGKWFLNTPEYLGWLEIKDQRMFCHGIPGAGKTFITAIMIDDLNQRFIERPDIGIVYFYCSLYRDDRKRDDILHLSFLKQLARQYWNRFPKGDLVDRLYKSHETTDERPQPEEVGETIRFLVETFNHIFVIVDALDEWGHPGNLPDIFVRLKYPQTSLFATSRPIKETMDKFKTSIQLEIKAHDTDVDKYLDISLVNGQSSILR